jgi:NADH-quinone oxidoreductase subunit G
VLGNLLALEGFDYEDAFQARDQLRALCGDVDPFEVPSWPGGGIAPAGGAGLCRVGDVPIYASDALVRRAVPLQSTADARFDGLQVGPMLAAELGLDDGAEATVRQNGSSARFRVSVVPSLAPGCVRLVGGVPQTQRLGPAYGPIEITRD